MYMYVCRCWIERLRWTTRADGWTPHPGITSLSWTSETNTHYVTTHSLPISISLYTHADLPASWGLPTPLSSTRETGTNGSPLPSRRTLHCPVCTHTYNVYVREMRRKEERSKQGHTNKANTPKEVTFPKNNELPRVGLEPTILAQLITPPYLLPPHLSPPIHR